MSASRAAAVVLATGALVATASCKPAIRRGIDLAFVVPVTFLTPVSRAAVGSHHPTPVECVALCGYDPDLPEVAGEWALSCTFGQIVGTSGIATDVVVCRGRIPSNMVDESTWSPIPDMSFNQ